MKYPLRYMRCPVHHNNIMSVYEGYDIKFFSDQIEKTYLFTCGLCGRIYVNPIGHSIDGIENSKKVIQGRPEEIYYTSSEVLINKPVIEKNSIEKIKQFAPKKSISGDASFPKGNYIRFKKCINGESGSLMKTLTNILNEYPALGHYTNIQKFVEKLFPSKIPQSCVVRNMSVSDQNGDLKRRAEIYVKSSNTLIKCLPSNASIGLCGKVSGGFFIIDDIKIVSNPILNKDDIVDSFIVLYDENKYPTNCLYTLLSGAAKEPQTIKSELKAWDDYLDWKKQLIELKIQGIKYIGVRFDVENKEITFLTVHDDKEDYKKFKRSLQRNNVSAFSNNYSKTRDRFVFNNNESDYKGDSGVELVFLREAANYNISLVNISDWDNNRGFFKKYTSDAEEISLTKELSIIRQEYINPVFSELVFEFSENGSGLVEKYQSKRKRIYGNIYEDLANEFYFDGFLANSQIGDFALIKRFKNATQDLIQGKAASHCLEKWLFDISKARKPKNIDEISVWQNANINSSQKAAVEKILAVPDVCLIQGPPGTGKTTVIAEAIYQSVIRGKRVLVASQANLAVDNAMERLISNPVVRAIRLGNESKIDNSVDSIKEKNVLNSFYNSITDYLKSNYTDKWKEYDEKVRSYEKDIEAVNAYEQEFAEINKEIKKINISAISKEISSNIYKHNGLIKDARQNKLNLNQIVSYFTGSLVELDFDISKDDAKVIWSAIAEELKSIEENQVMLSTKKVDYVELLFAENDKSDVMILINKLLLEYLSNIIRFSNLKDKLMSDKCETVCVELDLLKLQEQDLRAEMLNNSDPQIYCQWVEVSKKIESFSSRQVMTELEKSFFRQCNLENYTTDSIIPIIDKVNSVIENIKANTIDAVTQLVSEYADIQKRESEICDKLQAELEFLLDSFNAKRKYIFDLEMKKSDIVNKYTYDETKFLKIVEDKIEQLKEEYNVSERSEWENLFSGFINWIDAIPDYEQEKEFFLKTFINGCNVVGVSCTENVKTLNSAGFDAFDVVIIDEVSKATPPELLIPMLRGRKIVLVGDHRQLPPLFNEHDKSYEELAKQQENMDDISVTLTMDDFLKYKDMVTSSLFQRYFENAPDEIKETLTIQYRMHSDIMNIINLFYEGSLVDGNKGKNVKEHGLSISSITGSSMIVPDRHAYWFDSSNLNGVDVFEQRREGSSSAENIVEARAIVELLKKMEHEYANKNLDEKISVGVISFYYDQVALLRELVKMESFNAINVVINTVDRFQGKEKEIIIVSLVRNVFNAKHSVNSHIAAFQRINVAFSRAQNLLIIVGAKDMYAPQPVEISGMNNSDKKIVYVYQEILQMMHMNGTLFNCDDVIPHYLIPEILEEAGRGVKKL